jgi:cytochrome P450
LGPLRWRLPTPESRRGHRQRALMDDTVNELVAERRRGGGSGDVLSRFVESGARIGADDADLRGTIKAWFGAENLHTHTAWTCYLLAQNPDAQARLHEELDRVLGDRPPTPADLSALDYTKRVTKESLRIYPSVPAFFRGVEGDFRLGDDVVPSGSLLGFSPWVLHRDARYWDEPRRFNPDRWLADAPKAPPYAYLPFATGDFRCPGTVKSVNEGPLVLAAIAQKWRMTEQRGARPPVAAATWSLQAKRGIPLVVSRRTT